MCHFKESWADFVGYDLFGNEYNCKYPPNKELYGADYDGYASPNQLTFFYDFCIHQVTEPAMAANVVGSTYPNPLTGASTVTVLVVSVVCNFFASASVLHGKVTSLRIHSDRRS